jgi:putative GTP pyrophosphokinase
MNPHYSPPDKILLERVYQEAKPQYERLIDEVLFIIRKAFEEKKLDISSIEGRVKKFDSFYKKIIRKQAVGNVFEIIEDFAGIRILCLYRSNLNSIEKILRSRLVVVKAEVLRDRKDMAFGYMSDHYIVKIPANYCGERYDAIKRLKCEIQVRTISMHAWATVSHHLDYKQDVDIPSNLKNDFYALSGIFYIADSLFEQFKIARQETVNALTKSSKEEGFDLDAEFNFDTMRAYLEFKLPERASFDDARSISGILGDLAKAKVKTYRELDSIIDENMKWLSIKEKKNPPRDVYTIKGRRVEEDTSYTAVGVIRVILRDKLRKLK